MSKEKRMLLCPFCGGEAKIDMLDMGQYLYAVECKNCGCRTSSEETEEEAIAVWNRRTPYVVRCSECVHCEPLETADKTRLIHCTICMHNMPLDGYCSNGRRKEQAI